MVKIGQQVTDVKFQAFQDEQIKELKLSDYRGKWVVLLFYPADFTFICPTELKEASNYHERFQELDAEILSVSTDTVFVHKAWHDQSPTIQTIRFPMVADPSGRLSREFGTYLEDEGLSLRGTFIIDPDGILRSLEIHDNSIGRSIKEAYRKLQAAKFVRDHDGVEVCPASWEPGQSTLKPHLDIVGKI